MFNKKHLILVIALGWWLSSFGLPQPEVKGIYLSQGTVENTSYLTDLISQAKQTGINTFVIDYNRASSRYAKNIQLVEQSDIDYVARIVVFPGGGTDGQVKSKVYWQKKHQLVSQALSLGAKSVQLDYIRYSSKQSPSSQNARDIYKVINWFRQQIPKNIPLQIDVFGETSFGESIYIGQNLVLFADAVDAVCPMVYPSHYEPQAKYGQDPYFTITTSLRALLAQFAGDPPFAVYPFIEMSNYRLRQSNSDRQKYIYAELQAVTDMGVDGWYAWSAGNKYANLFKVLRERNLT